MKKLIAILAIMVVLVGAVFATDPNTGNTAVRVVTTVGVEEPSFKLTTTLATSGVLGSNAPVVFADDPTVVDASATDAYHVISPNTLTSTTQQTTSVDFAIMQTQASKSYKYYTFTVAVSDLELVKKYDNEGNLVDFALGEGQSFANDQFFACTTPAPNPVRGTSDTNIADQQIAAGYKIKYNGVKVNEGVQIATFTCTWTNKPEAVPGQYEATVVLTVAAN